jgi:hypothetical protein
MQCAEVKSIPAHSMSDENKSKGRGCLFYGLITVALVFVGVIAGIYFGTRKAVRYAIETYTTNAPAPIPQLRVPPGERRTIANSVLQKFEASANNRGSDELTLGEDELNSLIAVSPDLRKFSGHVYLQPQGEEIKAYISLPLDQFKQWQEFAQKMGGTNYAGRYVNGIAYVNLVVTNGLLQVAPRKMVVSAKTLPDQFIKQFPWHSIADPVNNNPDFRSALQQVESVSVADSKVRLKFRR